MTGRNINLIVLLLLWISISGCYSENGVPPTGLSTAPSESNQPGQPDQPGLPDDSPSDNSADNQISSKKMLKIVLESGASLDESRSLASASSLDMKAVVVDTDGKIIRDIAVTWWLSGALTTSELLVLGNGNADARAIFTGITPGAGWIHATIMNQKIVEDLNLISSSAVTGKISVESDHVPHSILLYSGNLQTSQVGTLLPLPLTAKVLDSYLNPVSGALVSFGVSAGGGSIASDILVVTDANGLARATVRLGTSSVQSNGHSFSATVMGTTLKTLFMATATPGIASKLHFSRSPSVANAGSNFYIQPLVEVQDQYGNQVTNSNASITISVGTGTGTLSGTTTIAAVQGVATFLDLNYSTSESGVVLRAESTELIGANSDAFTVGNIIAAAQCATNGGGWLTIDGGCKNLTTGLTWSAPSNLTMNWHQAVWDSTFAGSEPVDVDDEGFDNDYDPEKIPSTGKDTNGLGYCHNLVESGYSDWRLPTRQELEDAYINSSATYMSDVSTLYWSSTEHSNPEHSWARKLNGGQENNYKTVTNWAKTRCVRRSDVTGLAFQVQPSAPTYGFGVGVVFEQGPVIAIVDGTGSTVQTRTDLVTVSVVGGTGVLSGTTSINAVKGIATFSDLRYNKEETIRLQFSMAGLASITSNPIAINQTYPYSKCQSPGGGWVDVASGCKNLATGLTWSAPSLSTMNWHNAVWDSATGSSSDSYDNGRLNDYDLTTTTTELDISSAAYCHDLTESGSSDWRLPTIKELENAYINSAATHMSDVSTWYWSSTERSSPYSYQAWLRRLDGNLRELSKTDATLAKARCVRRDAPHHLYFSTQPLPDSYGFGVNVNFTVQVQIQDADNSPTISTSDVTLTVVNGTGNLWENGVNKGTSVTRAAVNGFATFTLAYDKAETIQLRATSGSLISVDSNNIIINQTYPGGRCQSPGGGWVDVASGCKNLATGLTWSAPSLSTMNWHNAVWDSALAGSSFQDSYDNGRSNDYDPAYTPFGHDTSSVAYCHDLTESGSSDWRLPTRQEMIDAYTNLAATHMSDVSTWYWTSWENSGSSGLAKVRKFDGNETDATKTDANQFKTRCVRRDAPHHLYFSTQPLPDSYGFGVNVNFTVQVQIQDADNSPTISTSDVTLTVVNGTGNLWENGVNKGTSVTRAAVNGFATFTLAYDKAETIQLRTTSGSLVSVNSNNIIINQTYPGASCKTVGGSWQDLNGGCKDMSTGLIWSAISKSKMNWHDAVWELNGAANAGTQDSYDNGKTHEYDQDYQPTANFDNSPVNYCHDLTESGFYDWRLPKRAELTDLGVKSFQTYLNLKLDEGYWSSTTLLEPNARREILYSNGNINDDEGNKTSSLFYTICVRRDQPSQLSMTLSDPGASGYGAGIPFDVTVAIRDIDNAPTLASSNITLEVIGGSGNLWMGSSSGRSFTLPATNGQVTFSQISYDGAGQTIQLKATSETINYHSSPVSITPITSSNLVFPTQHSGSNCASAPSGWASQNGGCRDLDSSGLIWYGPSSKRMSKTNAQAFCSNHSFNGFSGWRLPTEAEVEAAKTRNWFSAINYYSSWNGYWTSTNVDASNSRRFCFDSNFSGNFNWDQANIISELYFYCVR